MTLLSKPHCHVKTFEEVLISTSKGTRGTATAATPTRWLIQVERVVLNTLAKDAALPPDPPKADCASGDSSTIAFRHGESSIGEVEPPTRNAQVASQGPLYILLTF